jgi:prepilin peptidase CpaA
MRKSGCKARQRETRKQIDLSLIPLLLAACCLLLAAVSDVRAYRIPNIYPACLLLLFLGTRLVWGFSPADWQHLLHFAIALATGMLLFRIGWVGGGDAKLYAAAAIWFAGLNAALLIFATGMAGLVLAIFYIVKRQISRKVDSTKRSERRIPYGVAIAGGALAMGLMVRLPGLIPLA